MNGNIVQLLTSLLYALPNIMQILFHYQEVMLKDTTLPEDKIKAKTLLEGLKWKSWEDLEKGV